MYVLCVSISVRVYGMYVCIHSCLFIGRFFAVCVSRVCLYVLFSIDIHLS